MKIEKRRLGNTDMDASVLGFGAAEIGFHGVDAKTAERILGSALDAGLNVIDTAECYAGSEELIGGAVSSRRDAYYLFSKVGHPDGFGKPHDWTAPSIGRSIERSLKRLKTDRLDLIQLHSCELATLEKGEAIEAIEKAKKRGLVRYVGYSGDGEAARWALESGRFDVLQTSVSIADQEAIDLLLPLARDKNVGVIAKRPIANAVWRSKKKPESEYHHVYWDRIGKLAYDFLGTDASFSTALRFTLSQPGVHTAIVGTTSPTRWAENARLLEAGPLPKKEVDAIRARWQKVAKKDWVGQT
jgi:aryl-alcohol dehydrogenase-like predicted oxidoreductase